MVLAECLMSERLVNLSDSAVINGGVLLDGCRSISATTKKGRNVAAGGVASGSVKFGFDK